MMPLNTLVSAIEDHIGRERRIDPLRDRYSVSIDAQESGRIRPEHGMQRERGLVLNIRVNYWANDAEQYEARRNAERSLYEFLYRDVRSKLVQIRGIADHGDRHAIQMALTDLISEVEGGR